MAQDGMRKVCKISREVLDVAAKEIKPGVTTDYLDEVVHNACIERNVCDECLFSEGGLNELITLGIPLPSELQQVSEILLYLGQ